MAKHFMELFLTLMIGLGSYQPFPPPNDMRVIEENNLENIAKIIASDYNLDYNIVEAIIWVESRWNPNAISDGGDYGLMQINQCNHNWLEKELGIYDWLEPQQNILAGCHILRKLFNKYDDVRMVLMAYNMGEGGAQRLWEQGIYETEYTRKVLTRYNGRLV